MCMYDMMAWTKKSMKKPYDSKDQSSKDFNNIIGITVA